MNINKTQHLNIPPHILSDCLQNDTKAQSALYRLCHAHLMRIGLRYSAGDRQAALANVNMAFLKILQKLETYKSHIPFEAWIRRIMINVVIDDFRAQKNYQAHIQRQDMETISEQETYFEWNEAEIRLNAEDIQTLIGKLPPATAQIFNMFTFDDYTHREIAVELDITESASKWHVAKAKTILKKLIVGELKVER